jgi:hypothetical protein
MSDRDGLHDDGPAWMHSGSSAPSRSSRRTERLKSSARRRNGNRIFGIGAALLLAGLLIWGVASIIGQFAGNDEPEAELFTGPVPTTAGADGILAENVALTALDAGQCLMDFENINQPVTVVTCSTPHNGQVLATELFPGDADYPGDDGLAARAKEVCDSADLNEQAAASFGELQVTQATPSAKSWAEGDRRVDCIVYTEEGNILNKSLLNG